MKTLPTLEEINKLVTFSRDEEGNLEVLDVNYSVTGTVYGDVEGSVIGTVYGDVRGKVAGSVRGNVGGSFDGLPEPQVLGAYMYDDLADFNSSVGYKVNDAFEDGFRMARMKWRPPIDTVECDDGKITSLNRTTNLRDPSAQLAQ
jgi:uncharacterized protein YcfJ